MTAATWERITQNFIEVKIKNDISSVCDIGHDRFGFFKEKLGESIKYYTDAEKMLKSGECDAVIICVPHYQHPELAILAMDNNQLVKTPRILRHRLMTCNLVG